MATSMTRAEVDAYLDGQRTLTLTTLRRDGSPVAHPMWFVRIGANVYVDTRATSLKHRNVLSDPRVCAVVESGESYFELRGVRIEGACSPVSDASEIEQAKAALRDKDETLGSGMRDMPAWFTESRDSRRSSGDRVILRVPMDRIHSWDFSKVREHYERRSAPARATNGSDSHT